MSSQDDLGGEELRCRFVVVGASDGLSSHSVFTVVAPVRADAVSGLRSVLADMATDVAGNPHLPFGRLPTLHFASLALFPAQGSFPATLVFESNVDGTIADYLAQVAAVAGAGADAIWGGCPGYPSGATDDPGQVQRWLRHHVVLPGAYHVGATGRTRGQIVAEAELREALEIELDERQDAGRLPADPVAIRRGLQDRVWYDPALAWAVDPLPVRTGHDQLRHIGHVAGSADTTVLVPAVPALALLAALTRRRPLAALGLVASGVAWLWWVEGRDPPDDCAVDAAALTAIERCEDRPGAVQNHLASLTYVKPSAGRVTLVRAVLFVINLAARVKYTKGELGGIPSIHFAHWSLIDGGRRLLFVSNYDGSWESYLDDFIEKAASGLSAVWSNAVDFPPCRWLGLRSGGARHGLPFKRMARRSQTPTTVHYSAYPGQSLTNVLSNTELRRGLFADLDDHELQQWLLKL
ncbi:MAG: hypothetical protein KY452_05120 [Actinobacteria bacterium]|nr:hypothetical protein [Actinomycetota bacterium]